MVKKKVAKILSFRYAFLALILLVLAGGLIFLPKESKQEGIKAEKLLTDVISTERYISTDQIADKIINQDPSFILIDVRDSENFNKYSLPNAVHIPLKDLLNEEYENYLNQNQFDIVFYSNDNFYADQAWVLGSRLGYKNLRVLEGGINQWYQTIINPTLPDEGMSGENFELFTTRKAASMYFGVRYPEEKEFTPIVTKPVIKTIVPVKKKKKRPVEGGC